MTTFILQVHAISKSFGGLAILKNFSIDIEQNSITAIIGPNGAGKTTLFNVLTGLLRPTAGDILFNGRSIRKMEAYQRVKLGLVRSFQEVRLIRGLTVLENIMIALRTSNNEGIIPAVFLRKKIKREEIALKELGFSMLEEAGLQTKANELASDLSYGQAKLLELSRVKAMMPKLLLLDEPASGLSLVVLDQIKKQLESMKRKGITILFIEHNVPFVSDIADRVIVMNKGEKIFAGEPSGIMSNPNVIEAYLGRARGGEKGQHEPTCT